VGIPPLWSVDILQRSGEAYTSLAPQRIAPAARRFVTAWDFLFPSCQSAGRMANTKISRRKNKKIQRGDPLSR
jgi:hypothetical protein